MRKLAFLYLLLALTYIALQSCSIEPFEAPTWDVGLNLPVLTEDYTMQDLADDEEAIKVVNDSLIVEVTEALAEVSLAGKFDFNPYRGEFGVSIGTFEIKAIDPAGVTFTIGEVWDSAGALSGRLEVPPFCFPGAGEPVASKEVALGGNFAWGEVASGLLDVTVENRLEVPLGDPARGCPLTLRVSWYGGVWDSIVLGESIPAGEARSVEVDLARRTIANTVLVAITGGSPGSDGEVDFSPAQEIGISVAPRDIAVSRALASIPAQSFEAERSITVEDSTRVVLAGIESGTFTLGIFNEMAIDLSVTVTTDNLAHGASRFAYSTNVAAWSSGEVEVDLAGYTLETDAVGGDPWYGTNTVTFEVLAETRGTENHVEVEFADSVRVTVDMRDIVFDRVVGTLKPTPVGISEEHEIDLPEICRAVSISDATMVLSIRNEAMVGGDFEVEVTGQSGGETQTAVLTGEIIPADLSGAPSETEYEYDSQEVRDLISLVPDLIRIEGNATVWGQGRVYNSDALRGDLTIAFPLVFEVGGDSVRFDPRDFDISQDVRDEIEEAAQEADFCGRLVTDFDLSGAFNIYIAADSAGVYTAPLLSLAKPGGYAPFGNGGVRESEFDIHLAREDLEIFLSEKLWLGLEVIFDPGDDAVTARPDNYLRLQGYLRLVRRVD
jgi:hypothetical protein